MKITTNPDKAIVDKIKEGLKKTGGYCPCRLERIEDNKCMCKEFKDQIKDPDFEGIAIVCYIINQRINEPQKYVGRNEVKYE